MLFVIDIGNTHTVAGIYQADIPVIHWRIKTDAAMTADELSIHYHNLFSIGSINAAKIDGVILSSVVPQLDAAYQSFCRMMFNGIDPHSIVSVNSDIVADLISVKLNNPSEVGADRLVNGIAAFQVCKSAVIVIDFGTAITFDCISDKCEYLGGLILPGLGISLGALSEKAAKLPQIDISIPPAQVIGTCTVTAMKSGVLHGYGSMIEGLIARVKAELAEMGMEQVDVIATGGMASIIQPFTSAINRVEPDLTLDGLNFIFTQLVGC